jgi:hypothetical protein
VIVWLGFWGTGLHNAFAYVGLQYTTATNGVILNSFIPVMIVALSYAFLHERLTRAQAIGAGIGAFEGATPGAAGSVAAFLAYNEARRWSRHSEEFGHGSPEGVAAPEAANNTVACTALVPMLSLGIPSSNSAAVLLGGFLMHELVPGPMLFVHMAGEPAKAVPHGVYLRARRVRRLRLPGELVQRRRRARLRRHRICLALLRRPVSADGAWRRSRFHDRVELPARVGSFERRSLDVRT